MADWIGGLGSAGMLALLGLLAGAFLRQIGALSKDGARRIGQAALMTAAAGLCYLLCGLLMRQTVRGDAVGNSQIWNAVGGAYVQTGFRMLEQPAGALPLSAAFGFLARVLGTVLFHQYRLAGFALAYAMTAASAALLLRRIEAWTDGQTAQDAVFLLLCLPGAVFFFLPCGVSLGLLILSCMVFVFGKRLPQSSFRINRSAYGVVLAVCACLSAAVLFGVADGRIG